MNARLAAILVLCSATSAWTQEKFVRASKNAIPDHYIVVFKDEAADRDDAPASRRPTVTVLTSELTRVQGMNGMEVKQIFNRAIKAFSGRMSRAQALALSRDSRVAFVEEDATMYATATQTNPPWGLDRIDQRNLPLSGSFTYTPNGDGVNVYIIDTGIHASHQELSGRVVSAFTAINDGLASDDCNGHGTHVAGTVGGTTYGVAKRATLYAVRVLGCDGSGTTSGVIAGVDYVTANRVLPAVANMSLGGGASTVLDAAVRRSVAAGVTYAVAAGNANTDACSTSPARTAEAITVAASTTADARASFSNYGTCVDVFAPGVAVLSSWYTSNTATASLSGTSMASPHVAGVAALYLDLNPSASPGAVATALLNATTPNKITSPGTGSPYRLLYSDFGSSGPTPPPAATLVTPSGATTDNNPTYTWNKVASATDYYLWVNGPSKTAVFKMWYSAASVCGSTTCSIKPGQMLAFGENTWWIQTRNAAGDGPWSAGTVFTVSAPGPAAPTLVSPSGTSQDAKPTYTWNKVTNATDYYLWINGPSGAAIHTRWYTSASVCPAAATTCAVKPELTLMAGAYVWWVQAASSGTNGPWSARMDFTLSYGLPAPTLVSPMGTTADNNPTYSWNAIPAATEYYLWVDGPAGNVEKQYYTAATICSGATCGVKPAAMLVAGNHTWWVQARNTSVTGPWSNGTIFAVAGPGAPTLISPLGAINTKSPSFTWNHQSVATDYYLWVNGPAGTPVFRMWYPASSICSGATCTINPALTLGGGNHQWWVQAKNGVGTGPWSAATTFSVPQ